MLVALLIIPCCPCSILNKLFEIKTNTSQEFWPIHWFTQIIKDNSVIIQKIFYSFDIFNRDGVHSDIIFIVFEHKSNIKWFKIGVHTFETSNLNFAQVENKEWNLSNINKTCFCWLDKTVTLKRSTIESFWSVRNFKSKLSTNKFHTSFSPCQKFPINFFSCFFLSLFIIRIFSHSPASSNNIFCTVPTLRIKLNILSLLFGNKNRLTKSKMNCCDNFIFTGLEKGKLNIWECNVNRLTFSSSVSETVEVTLKITFHFLLSNSGSRE